MKLRKLIPFVLLAATLILSSSCSKDNGVKNTITTETDAPKAEETTEAETEKDYYVAYTPEEKPKEVPPITHPLTGLSSDKDLSAKRPVSIMIDNSRTTLPQRGIAQADIIYECLAEGGIPRLMMISTTYENLSAIGYVRSARDYFIDFAQSYDCIFVHGGRSPYALKTIQNRGVNNIDGVKGPGLDAFSRDKNRTNAGYASWENLYIPSGKKLSSTIDSLGYSKTKAEGYENTMNFTEWGNILSLTKEAKHAKVHVSYDQIVDYVYNEKESVYYRFQYNGMAHMDSDAKKQLSFKNVIVMFTEQNLIAGDKKNRIDVRTTGTGNGYYITNGTYCEITWEKKTATSPIKYYYSDKTEVELNRGKTMISVVDVNYKNKTKFDNDTKLLTNNKK